MRLFARRNKGAMGECLELRSHFQTAIDGELDTATAERITRHLEVCRDCGLEWDTYEELKASIQRMRPPSTDAVARLNEFTDRLCAEDGHEH